jgi:hypothetical protein
MLSHPTTMSTMVYLRQFHFNVAFAVLLVVQCSAFQILRNNVGLQSKSTILLPSPDSNLFGNTRSNSPIIFMTDDSNDPDETDTQNVEETSKGGMGKTEEKRTGTMLLTIPLFCKFVLILLLKFVTDVIVFPLLFLYRLVGRGRRRFLSAIGKGGDKHEKTNGEA